MVHARGDPVVHARGDPRGDPVGVPVVYMPVGVPVVYMPVGCMPVVHGGCTVPATGAPTGAPDPASGVLAVHQARWRISEEFSRNLAKFRLNLLRNRLNSTHFETLRLFGSGPNKYGFLAKM